MMIRLFAPRTLIACGVSFCPFFAGAQEIALEKLAQIPVAQATEIVCYDASSRRLILTIGDVPEVAVIALGTDAQPAIERRIAFADLGAVVNSVAVHDGLVAAAVEASVSTDPGTIVFFNLDGQRLREVEVGPMPDMVTFTKDGRKLVVANEGESNADRSIDPIGSVSIIDVSSDFAVTTIPLGSDRPASKQTWFTLPGRLRPSLVEPEYIATSPDSSLAYVVCQENNAVFVIDLDTGVVRDRHWLGIVEWGKGDAEIDLDPKDDALSPIPANVISLRQPDAIIAFETPAGTRIVTANEGDPRDKWGDDGMVKAGGLQIAASSHRPGHPAVLFGSRGITLFDDDLNTLHDSTDTLERSIESLHRDGVISDEHVRAIDARSGKRGIEPESLATGLVDNRRFVFVGLERAGMIATFEYDEVHDALVHLCTTPISVDPRLEPAMVSPEGLAFIAAHSSPTGKPLLVVCDELHGTLTILSVSPDTAQ